MKGIKHIIFDLGGVLLEIDYNQAVRSFAALGVRNFDTLYAQAAQNQFFDDFETGRVNGPAFISEMQRLAADPLTETQIIDAWNSMLLYFPTRRMQLLQQLRLHYDLVLLSNTNELHEAAFNQLLMRDIGVPAIGVFFDKVYLSHRVGLKKPNPAIFQKILDDNGFKPAETLFIDDSRQHIEAANKLNINTIFLQPGMTIENDVFKPAPSEI